MYTITVKSWLETPTCVPVTNKKKKNKEEIVYPIFNKLAEFTDDSVWIQAMNNASKCIFPSGISFQNNELHYKKGNRNQTLYLSTPNERLFAEVKTFFNLWGGISSDRDKLQQNQNQIKEQQQMYQRWGQIKKKNIKNDLIIKYIYKLVQTLKLNEAEKRQLESVINGGFLSKTIKSNDIVMLNGEIDNIRNLHYNSTTRRFFTEEGRKKVTIKKEPKAKTNRYYQDWKNYITILYSQYSANQNSALINVNIPKTQLNKTTTDHSETSAPGDTEVSR